MKFSIIGSGNMAWFLGQRLIQAGHHCLGVFGRNKNTANQLSVQLDCPQFASLNDIPDQENHFCIIAASDYSIAEIATQFCFQKTLLLHTSGASSIQLLSQSAQQYGVAWCVYSIAKQEKNNDTIIPIAIEGNNEQASKRIFEFIKTIAQKCFEIKEEQRIALHLAAVFANNFTNHLVAISEAICQKEHIDFEMLKPLIQQTFERIENNKASDVQTGPAIREDIQSMQKHLALLNNNIAWKRLYESISASIRKMYNRIER